MSSINTSTNTNSHNQTTGDHIMEVLTYMKHKIPNSLLFFHMLFFRFVFENCNSTDQTYNNIFISYYVLSTIVCVIWEFLFYYFRIKSYKKRHGITLNRKDYLFCAVSTIVAVVAFLSTTFFLNVNGIMGECVLLNYNKIIASVMFFIGFALIVGISLVEKYYFQKDMKIEKVAIQE